MSDQYPQYGAMPPAPAYQQQPAGPAPSSVSLAVRLMFVEAAFSVVTVFYVLLARSQFRTAIRNANLNESAHRLDNLVNVAVTVALVFAVVFLVLYVLLALQVRKGKNWARIVTWVFAGLGAVSALSSLAQDEPVLNKVISVVQGILDVAIIVLLAQSRSNSYFRKQQF